MKLHHVFLFLVFLLEPKVEGGLTKSEYLNFKQYERSLASSVLENPLYNKDQRPPGIDNVDDHLDITFSLYILDLGLCSHKQNLVIGGYLRQFWTDPRLAVEGVEPKKIIYQPRDMFQNSRMWVPDTFIVESQTGFLREADTGTGRTFIRLHADGSVKSSMHFHTKALCPIPKNTQEGDVVECSLNFESYGYTNKDVHYQWQEDAWASEQIASEALEKLSNSGWILSDSRVENGTTVLSFGEYTNAKLVLTFEKKSTKEDSSSEE